jgi:hypothetical protein
MKTHVCLVSDQPIPNLLQPLSFWNKKRLSDYRLDFIENLVNLKMRLESWIGK